MGLRKLRVVIPAGWRARRLRNRALKRGVVYGTPGLMFDEPKLMKKKAVPPRT